MSYYDTRIINSRLPDYLRTRGSDLRYRGDHSFSTACPIHGGEKQNFKADQKPDGTWVWHCFSGCGGKGGDTITLHAELNGILSGSSESIKGAAEVLRIEPDSTFKPSMISTEERDRRRKAEIEKARQEALTKHLNEVFMQKLDPFLQEPDWRSALDFGSFIIDTRRRRYDSKLFVSSLFQDDDLIWMGNINDTGAERHRRNFRPVFEWLREESLPPRIAAGTFTRGAISRGRENVETAPFIVIESDELIGKKPETTEEKEMNKALSFGLFFYCQERLGLHPRAVIDTGNKSLHLWFDRPPPDDLAAVNRLAEGLRIDTGLLEKCHFSPLRLPGTLHTDTNTKAELLFINPVPKKS